MKTIDTIEALESAKINIEKTEAQELVSFLLNLIENLYSENEELKEENRKLKEELTGEDHPTFPKKQGRNKDISSEKDRKEAETSEDEITQKEGFKLDKKTLEHLKETNIPVFVLEKLKKINSQKYENKEKFVNAVEDLIGKDATRRYISHLVKYARYKKRNRSSKISKIPIDREQICEIDKTQLPADAIFKGHEPKVVQDLIIERDIVKFLREKYYSKSQKKTYLAEVPEGYEGEFGPSLNSSIYAMKYVNNMSIPKIVEFIRNYEILISVSYVTNRLIKHKYMEVFHEEKNDIFRAILEVSEYLQIDDTGCTVNGVKHYTQIICNALVTLFFTTERKDRLSVLDVMRNFEPRKFIFNEEAFLLLQHFKVSKKLINYLDEVEKNTVLNQEQIDQIIDNLLPNGKQVGKITITRIMEATAIAYYHQQSEWPIIKILVADDASQFKLLALYGLMLCWIHEGRHYKRLTPIVPVHQEQLDSFLKDYWAYYKKLFNFKNHPSEKDKKPLSLEFDELFSTKTGYNELNDRIAKSRAKKDELLKVLDNPEVPLHNNASENGARVEKRWEDVSLQTKSQEGTEAKDTMNTIKETAKKLEVKPIQYIHDRVNKIFKMPSLAELIRLKATSKTELCDSS